jgi:hypothetical protein
MIIIFIIRQIQVDAADQDLQRIGCALQSDFPLIEYRLKTVTYGISFAPYLAMRTLQQQTQEGKSRFPFGAVSIESYINIDDIFAGADA